MEDTEKVSRSEYDRTATNLAEKESTYKVPSLLATVFVLSWVVLFFAVVIPLFYRLPPARTMDDAKKNVFIAERAYRNLYTLSNIGYKLTGSKENEIEAVNFILGELAQIKELSLKEVFDMEIDLSRASGAIPYSNLLNTYQGVQNIAVKLSPKNCTSETYLLVNSHFDSKPFTPSAGDAGFMIATMLEVLRVISTTNQTIQHPIVFLFNGAEEGIMQASHGFVTQHKWAPYCRVVVNLEGGGSGGREVLFRSGPNHPWLLNYYKKYTKYPYATTVAEEIFETGLIPSDSDFTQFMKYGKIPGFDIVQLNNGYIYHTKYDVIDGIPRESFQNSGDNILSLVRGLANATELHDTEAHRGEHSIYFDYLGLYFIHYSETWAISLNLLTSATSLVLITISIWRMSAVSHIKVGQVGGQFILVFIIEAISFVLGLALPLIVAYVLDSYGLSLTHYSSPMLLIGLYACPSLLGLSLPITIYYNLNRNGKMPRSYQLQLALHGQAVVVALLVTCLTVFGIRSTYIVVIPLICYVVSLVLNLLSTLHDRGYAWTGLLKMGQIISFLHSSYITYILLVILIPICARSGSAFNADLYLAALTAAGTVLSFGFLVPLINTFRRPSYVVLTLLIITLLSLYLASHTHIGFPYRPRTSGQRVAYLQVRNKFYDYDGTLSKDESGYLFSFQDRREESPFLEGNVNLTGLASITSRCEKQMMCGLPLYDYRYVKNRHQSKWLPRSESIEPPSTPDLEMLSKTVVNRTTVRFEFNLTGPTHMSLFFKTYEDVEISNWSFLRSYLDNPPVHPLAYHIYFTYGIDSSPLNFFVELSKENGDFEVPLFQLGVSKHFIETDGDAESLKFASSFPSFGILATWPVLYQRYIF